MLKKSVMILSSIFLIQLALASVSVDNISLQNNYVLGESIRGTVNLTVVDEPSTSLFTSNLDGDMTIKDFLNANNINNFCSTMNCAEDYSASDGAASKTFQITPGTNQTIGLKLTGGDVDVGSLTFLISSNFKESQELPLRIDYLDNGVWEFANFSDSYTESVSGYNDASQNGVQLLGTLGYCQEVYLEKAKSLSVGAHIQESGFANLTMGLYITGEAPEAQCVYAGGDGCLLRLNEGLLDGTYYVCVKDENGQGLSLLTEDVSAAKNGAVLNGDKLNAQNKNYGVFVKPENYADFSLLDLSTFFNEFPTMANNYISNYYNGDCSDSCTLPIKFSGISQSVTLSGLSLIHTLDDGGENIESNFYSVSRTPAIVNYGGVVDLEEFGFQVSNEDEFELYLEGGLLVQEGINISSTVISDVYPREVPAGVPIEFRIVTNSSNLTGYSIKWSFGDGLNRTSSESFLEHTYKNISNYTLIVEVSRNNISQIKSFQVQAFSPRTIINYTINRKREILSDIEDDANSYSSSAKIREALRLDYFNSRLDDFTRDYNQSVSEADYVAVATALFNLRIPLSIHSSKITDFLIFEDSDIDLVKLSAVTGENYNTSSANQYKQAIQRWFTNNIVVDLEEESVMAVYEGGDKSTVLTMYKLTFDSSFSDTSYVIIDKPLSSLGFSSNVNVASEGASSYFTLSASGDKVVTFSIINASSPTIFIAPKFSQLVLDDSDMDVNDVCNFDGVCDSGENSSNCRDDCKPVNILIGYGIGIAILFLLVFISISVWYQRHKEEILFGDRRQLFNLLKFITNARDKNMKDKDIEKMLIEKGWVKEKIGYAFSKSKKLDKVSISSFNNFIDKKIYAGAELPKTNNAITPSRQQSTQKINKPGFQRNIKKR